MRMQHLLLLSSIALSSPAMAAEPKQAATVKGKPGTEATSRSDLASSAASDEAMPIRPTRKNRVRYSFPPSTRRM